MRTSRCREFLPVVLNFLQSEKSNEPIDQTNHPFGDRSKCEKRGRSKISDRLQADGEMTVLAGALGFPRRQAVWGICQESLTPPLSVLLSASATFL